MRRQVLERGGALHAPYSRSGGSLPSGVGGADAPSISFDSHNRDNRTPHPTR